MFNKLRLLKLNKLTENELRLINDVYFMQRVNTGLLVRDYKLISVDTK